MNWTLLAAPAFFAVVLLFFRERYARLHLDLHQEGGDAEAAALLGGGKAAAEEASLLEEESGGARRLLLAVN